MAKIVRMAEQGLPRWFSPEHAGEKLAEIALGLHGVLGDMRDGKTRGILKRLQGIHKTAEKYARYYVSECPIQSVRIMQPSGAIFVRLATGEEVLVPRSKSATDEIDVMIDDSGTYETSGGS